jgi:hypothetical protein
MPPRWFLSLPLEWKPRNLCSHGPAIISRLVLADDARWPSSPGLADSRPTIQKQQEAGTPNRQQIDNVTEQPAGERLSGSLGRAASTAIRCHRSWHSASVWVYGEQRLRYRGPSLDPPLPAKEQATLRYRCSAGYLGCRSSQALVARVTFGDCPLNLRLTSSFSNLPFLHHKPKHSKSPSTATIVILVVCRTLHSASPTEFSHFPPGRGQAILTALHSPQQTNPSEVAHLTNTPCCALRDRSPRHPSSPPPPSSHPRRRIDSFSPFHSSSHIRYARKDAR